MVGSVWSGISPYADYSLYGKGGKGAQAQEESAPSALEAACPIAEVRNPVAVAEAEESAGLSLAGNNVNASVVASQLATDENSASPAAAAANGGGGGSEEEEDETITIYKTIVLADGSKLLQIITKKPDGSTSTTTTRLPGTGKQQGDSEKKVVDTMQSDKDESGEPDSVGAVAAGMMEKSAGLQED